VGIYLAAVGDFSLAADIGQYSLWRSLAATSADHGRERLDSMDSSLAATSLRRFKLRDL
jgi:hypothetical protein